MLIQDVFCRREVRVKSARVWPARSGYDAPASTSMVANRDVVAVALVVVARRSGAFRCQRGSSRGGSRSPVWNRVEAGDPTVADFVATSPQKEKKEATVFGDHFMPDLA